MNRQYQIDVLNAFFMKQSEFSKQIMNLHLNKQNPYLCQINPSIYNQFHIKLLRMPKNQDCRLGKWKKTEHDRFMKALSKYGKNWSLIQKAVKTRTLAQVRSHSQKLFLSMTSKEITLFQEQINRRFDSFCSMKKERQSQKKEQKSAIKGQGVQLQESIQSQLAPRSNEDFNWNSCAIKINEEQRNAIEDTNQPKKDAVKVESSGISSSVVVAPPANYKCQQAEENINYNFMMVPYPQMFSQRINNMQYFFWLPC